jgi:DNA polymerase III subunit beta
VSDANTTTTVDNSCPVIGGDAAKFILPLADGKRVFKQGLAAYSKDETTTRQYLGGVHLALDGHRLRATSSDGHRLFRAWVEAPEGMLQPGPPASDNGVIVPGEACKTFASLVFPEIRISGTWIEARTEDRMHAFRLIDATFPNVDRIIPAPSDNTAEIASAELLDALKKLHGAAEHKRPIVKIEWLDSALQLSLAHHSRVAPEKIIAKTSGNASLGCNVKYLQSLVTAIGTKQVVLDATAEPGSPMRITAPSDADLLALLMPCRVQEEVVAPTEEGGDE